MADNAHMETGQTFIKSYCRQAVNNLCDTISLKPSDPLVPLEQYIANMQSLSQIWALRMSNFWIRIIILLQSF